jgi:hypothetical protein
MLRAVWVADLLARVVDGRDDAWIERWFGSFAVQWALFRLMARSFSVTAAEGFSGTVVYELTSPVSGAPSRWWALDVYGSVAVASAGVPADLASVAAVLHLPVSDFVRAGAGLIDPAEPLLQGRARFEGDLGLGVRLPEMFGAPTPRV